MNSDDPTRAIIRALAIELRVSEAEVRAAQSLKTDLRMDSIAAINVMFALEDECEIEIELSEGESFDTLGAIVAIVRRVLDAKA